MEKKGKALCDSQELWDSFCFPGMTTLSDANRAFAATHAKVLAAPMAPQSDYSEEEEEEEEVIDAEEKERTVDASTIYPPVALSSAPHHSVFPNPETPLLFAINCGAFSYGSFARSIDEKFYRRTMEMRRSHSFDGRHTIKIRCSVDAALTGDGYKWRKYGQKSIKNSPYPRSYYRCSIPRCCAKKQVERCAEDPGALTVTYEGLHLHHYRCTSSLRASWSSSSSRNESLKQCRDENRHFEPSHRSQLQNGEEGNCRFEPPHQSQLQNREDGKRTAENREGLLEDIVPPGVLRPPSPSNSPLPSSLPLPSEW